MTLTIDPTSFVAPYEQLRTQLVAAIRSGSLPAGSRLPTVRGLARELGLAPNTVARTYRELEQAGVVRTQGRLGTFVEHPGGAAERAALAAAQAYVHTARGLGLDDAATLRWVRDAQRAIGGSTAG